MRTCGFLSCHFSKKRYFSLAEKNFLSFAGRPGAFHRNLFLFMPPAPRQRMLSTFEDSMTYVKDYVDVEETAHTLSQPERKSAGHARSASAKKTGRPKKQNAPPDPDATAEQANAEATPPPTDAAPDNGKKSAQRARSGRTRSATGGSTGAKKAPRPKKGVMPASDEHNTAPVSAADIPPAAEDDERLHVAEEPALARPAEELPPLPATAVFTPEQEEGANAPAANASPAKARVAGRAGRAAKKAAEPPSDAGAHVSPPAAVSSSGLPSGEEPYPAHTESSSGPPSGEEPYPARTESSSGPPSGEEPYPARTDAAGESPADAPVAGIFLEETDADEAFTAVLPYDELLPEAVPLAGVFQADIAVGEFSPPSDDFTARPIPGPEDAATPVTTVSDAEPFAPSAITASDPYEEVPATEDADAPVAVEATPELSDEEENDGTETSEEPGRKRRRSRRGGRGRRKNSRAGNDTEAAAVETELAPDDTRPADAPLPEVPDGTRAGPETEDSPDDEDAPRTAGAKSKARRKMYVSVLPGEQVEVVITEEGQVQEYYVEMLHQAKTKGNIYKGVVNNVDPNLQAAFVGYGAARNGFLQIDELHPEYYIAPHDGSRGRKYPLIQKILKPGQEVLVQVVKEPSGAKGAFLTTYLSMPGRFLVLTPGREQIGVSRKVEDDVERARLRELLEGLDPGPGLGVIVRTVSMGASKTSLQRDLQFLKRTWKEVRARGTSEAAPCMVYQEMDLTARAVRDYLNESIGEVRIDDEATAAVVTEVAEALFPRRKNLVRVHKDPGTGLFERFNIQRQLDQIHSREVTLPSGGRLVIDSTEALTAIDINSGRSGGKNNFEDLAYRTNMEAAAMIPLQLRLRDIGGQIVADFIEMRDRSSWREVEKTLRNGMKVDRARYDIGKISSFGLLEMVRQRLGSSAISVSTEPCPCCNGTGVRRNMEWRCQHALRDIRNLMRNAQTKNESATEYYAEPELALHLLNHKRKLLSDLEGNYGVALIITSRTSDAG
jgi:ribonuclease E